MDARARSAQHGIELWAIPADAGPAPPPPCTPTDQTLCLGGGRFRAEVTWGDVSGGTGAGHSINLGDRTGAFWFFSPSNFELMVKVLDGRSLNGHHWVFWGALTNVEFTLTVTDTESGETWTRHNLLGEFASGGDTEAFAGE